MRAEWQRGQRDKKPLSLLMCDVDCFKSYNDTYGHLAGDLCLKKFAAVLTAQLKRPADLAARYGGEEFAIVLPDTDLAGAQLLAEACRAQLEQLAIANPGAHGRHRHHVDRRGLPHAFQGQLAGSPDRRGRCGACMRPSGGDVTGLFAGDAGLAPQVPVPFLK